MFNIQASRDNKMFVTIVNGTGARLVDEITAVAGSSILTEIDKPAWILWTASLFPGT